MKKKTRENTEEGACREPDESQTEEATAEVQSAEDFALEGLPYWLSMIAEIYTRGGHIDALAYATEDGGMHVRFGACKAVEEDPLGFLRWLTEGLVPSDAPPEAEATRH